MLRRAIERRARTGDGYGGERCECGEAESGRVKVSNFNFFSLITSPSRGIAYRHCGDKSTTFASSRYTCGTLPSLLHHHAVASCLLLNGVKSETVCQDEHETTHCN
jgi:hypothetical protein